LSALCKRTPDGPVFSIFKNPEDGPAYPKTAPAHGSAARQATILVQKECALVGPIIPEPTFGQLELLGGKVCSQRRVETRRLSAPLNFLRRTSARAPRGRCARRPTRATAGDTPPRKPVDELGRKAVTLCGPDVTPTRGRRRKRHRSSLPPTGDQGKTKCPRQFALSRTNAGLHVENRSSKSVHRAQPASRNFVGNIYKGRVFNIRAQASGRFVRCRRRPAMVSCTVQLTSNPVLQAPPARAGRLRHTVPTRTTTKKTSAPPLPFSAISPPHHFRPFSALNSPYSSLSLPPPSAFPFSPPHPPIFCRR